MRDRAHSSWCLACPSELLHGKVDQAVMIRRKSGTAVLMPLLNLALVGQIARDVSFYHDP